MPFIKKEREKEVIGLYKLDKSAKDIAEITKISHHTVLRILKRNNVKIKSTYYYRKFQESKRRLILPEEEIIKLYETCSSYDIAKKYNCSVSKIFCVLKENNIKIKGQSYFNKMKREKLRELKGIEVRDRKDEIIELYNSKNDIVTIAKLFLCSTQMIYKVLRENKVTMHRYSGKEYVSKLNLPEEDIIKLYQQGVGIHEIAKTNKCNHWCIYKVLRKNNQEIYGRKTSWGKRYGLEKSAILKSIQSEKFKKLHAETGVFASFKGKTHTQEVKDRIQKSRAWYKHSKETKIKIGKANKGKHNSPKTEFKKGKKLTDAQHKKMIEKWANEEYRTKQLKKMAQGHNITPNKPEKLIINLIKQYNLNFVFVGDWSYVINGFNPDFINVEKKKIIEFFGYYWHNLPEAKERDKRKIQTYEDKGYQLMIINENELDNPDNIVMKIKEFSNDK